MKRRNVEAVTFKHRGQYFKLYNTTDCITRDALMII